MTSAYISPLPRERYFPIFLDTCFQIISAISLVCSRTQALLILVGF
jgi:hypothetical protein